MKSLESFKASMSADELASTESLVGGVLGSCHCTYDFYGMCEQGGSSLLAAIAAWAHAGMCSEHNMF